MRKIFVMILVTLLYFSCITMTNTDSTAKASSEEDYYLDTEYIYNITKDLSDIINNTFIYPPGTLAKGRAYGSEGERFAAREIIKPQMINLGLDNVTLEPITDITDENAKKVIEGTGASGNLTAHMDVHAMGLTLNHSGNKTPVDCFITSIDNQSINRTNYTFYDLKIIKAENYTCTDDFLQNVTVSGPCKVVKLPLIRELFPEIDQWQDFKCDFFAAFWDNLTDNMTDQFQNYYNFTFDGIDSDNNSTYPSFLTPIENVSNGFVFFEENPLFNPDIQQLPSLEEDPSFNEMYIWTLMVKHIYRHLRLRAWNETYPTLRGLIQFDYDNDSHNTAEGSVWPNLTRIFINGSIGELINESVDEYTVDFYIDQSYNTSVESYNVIGQINGTNPNKTVIIGCLYDCVFNQGTVDSGIGMAMVLAIAKYFKHLHEDYNITPKYNLKFVAYAGEESGLRGAFHYEATHYDTEDITYIIDLNQVGYSQSDVPSILNVVSNRVCLKYKLETINEITDYTGRAEDGTELETLWAPLGSVSDELVFSVARFSRGVLAPLKYNYKTIMFLKDLGWYRHHRDGMNHTEGDSMNYYNESDVKLTSELVWNITKFITVNPDCWFEEEPTFTPIDNTNDNEDNYDEIKVSYTIKTMMPNDHVSVRMVLYPKFKLEHPCYPFLYRLRAEKEYVLTPDGISDFISITLPEHYPKGEYRAEVYLLNSTGEVMLNSIHLLGVELGINGLEYVQMIREEMFIDILEELSPLEGKIYKSLGIDVIEWIKRLPDLRNKRLRDIFIDILGFYKYRNNKCNDSFEMHPPNQPPNQPSTPTGETNVKTGKPYDYTTNAIDPEGDKIRFQWKWTSNGVPSIWSIHKYDSGEDCTESHRWKCTGEKEIVVRAKNPWSPNVFSVWSDPLSVTAEKSCYFDIITIHSYQNNINNPNILNSFNPNMVVVDEDVLYQGFSYGLEGSPSYNYNFNGEKTRSPEPNQIYNFTETGMKYVNLTVNTNNETVYYNTTVDVVNIRACFNMSQLGAQPNQTIFFNDTSISNKNINSWLWDFGDGNTSYDQNTSHNYSNTGVYNVSLNVTDIDDNFAVFWQIVYVETNPPEIIDVVHTPVPGTLGCNITLSTEVYDNSECGVDKVNFSVVYPNGTINDFTMYESNDSMYDYEFVFNDTWQVGWYYYTLWVTDYANNSNNFTGCGFEIAPAFGYTNLGNNTQDIADRITGSNFTILVNGTAESVSAFIQANNSTKVKCVLYRTSDNLLMGTTEEKIINTGDKPDWVIFNFTTSKPNLSINVDYVLVCWSNNTCNLYYDDTSGVYSGRYKNYSYGAPPSPSITWDGNETRLYSIFCSYTTVPLITSVSASPSVVGFGFNTTITAVVENYFVPVDEIFVNITYPDNSTVNYTMTELDSDTFSYVFNDTWSVGQYNFSVWFVDTLGGNCSSTCYCFDVSSLASVSVCTKKDEYGGNEVIELTDPPSEKPLGPIGYELMDNDSVLRLWNRFNSYYFNTSNGIQFSNHFNKYWSHNVLMLGYYNNEEWNLVYRVDELSGFNKNIVSDNESFVNVTLWKDLSYGVYDFRLAIRYFLGVDDNELTVIPYIKNLGVEIPFVLGFAWEIKDIQVDMTFGGDYIEINGTSYFLNSSLNETYTDLVDSCFYIREDISNYSSESLYLGWDENLDYKVQVKSRDGQYNAPVTLGIKIGTLGVGQEKYTCLFWHDASEVVYYFNDFDSEECWNNEPDLMVDEEIESFAMTECNGSVELCTGNTCSGDNLGVISKVELRVNGYHEAESGCIILRPVFNGENDGENYTFETPQSESAWSVWFDITDDEGRNVSEGLAGWPWSAVKGLSCDVEASFEEECQLFCSMIELRVVYL